MLSELYVELCQETSLPAGNVQSNLPAAKTSAWARDGGQRGQAEIGAPLIEQDASCSFPAQPGHPGPLISAMCPPSRGTPRTTRLEGQVCQDLQQNLAMLNWERKLQLVGAQTWEF